MTLNSMRAWLAGEKGELCLQGLDVGTKTGKSKKDVVLNLEDLLEVGGDCLELDTESSVAADGNAVLTLHCDHGTSVVFENGHFIRFIRRFI